MAHCTIFVASITPQNNKIAISGQVFASPNNGPFSWECEHEWDAIAYDVNAMIRDTAVAALAAQNINVGANDKKTLVCPAVDI